MEWFYADAGEHVGPISEAQLAELVQSGAITRETLVWKEGTETWIPAFQAFPSRAVPPPIPTADEQRALVTPSAVRPRLLPVNTDGLTRRNETSVVDQAKEYWDGLARLQRAIIVVFALGLLLALSGSGLGVELCLLAMAAWVVLAVSKFVRSSFVPSEKTESDVSAPELVGVPLASPPASHYEGAESPRADPLSQTDESGMTVGDLPDAPPTTSAAALRAPVGLSRAQIRRAARVGAAVLVVALAGWGGVSMYQRSAAATERVALLSAAVESDFWSNTDNLVQVGEAAAAASDDDRALTKTFGGNGSRHAGEIAAAYSRYTAVSAGDLSRQIAHQQSEIERLERSAESAQSNLANYERRTFMVARRFDTSASGSASYEAFDLSAYRKAVLLDGGDHIQLNTPGRQVTLYVRDLGERPVSVTVSNAFRSYEQTEYYTHYRVEGSATELDRLVNETQAGLSEARRGLADLESRHQQAVTAALDEYVARVEPIVATLRDAE